MTENSTVTVMDRAIAIGEELASKDREVQARLQAPLPDPYLSWKPGQCWPSGGSHLATFFPYVDDAFLEERLDEVVGVKGWQVTYRSHEKVTECDLTIQFPSGPQIRQGIGCFESRDGDDANSEKGTRTLAFRDACKHFGICGRDTDGAQTIPVAVRAESKEYNGKMKHFIKEALEPLSRKLLRHSGQSTFKVPAYIRSVVLLTEDPASSRWLDAAEAHEGEQNPPPPTTPRKPAEQPQQAQDYRDSANIVFPYGKKHNGQKLTEIPTGYLEWAGANMDAFKPGNRNYNEFLVTAVAYYLEQQEKAQGDAQEPDEVGPDAMEFFDGVDVPEGL